MARVSQGQAFRPSARDWNRFLDAADWVAKRRGLQDTETSPLLRNTVLAKNTGDVDLGVFEVAQITPYTGVSGDSGLPLGDPLAGILLEVCLPTESAFGRFGIAAEKIPAGEIGRIFVTGVCPAWCVSTWDPTPLVNRPEHADTRASVPWLVPLVTGAAELLWDWPDPMPAVYTPVLQMIRFGRRNTDGVGITRTGALHFRACAEVIRFSDDVDVETQRYTWLNMPHVVGIKKR